MSYSSIQLFIQQTLTEYCVPSALGFMNETDMDLALKELIVKLRRETALS